MSDETKDGIVKLVEQSSKKARFWYLVHWTLLQNARWIGLLCSVIVPFGLAALLYIKDEPVSRTLNIILIVLSALAFALQAVEHFLRLPERASLFRKIWTEGETGLARYRDKLIDLAELSTVLEKQKHLYNEEHL
jgi:hypothetical protein